MHFVKAESETFEELPLFHAFKSRFIIELNVLNMNDSYSFFYYYYFVIIKVRESSSSGMMGNQDTVSIMLKSAYPDYP